MNIRDNSKESSNKSEEQKLNFISYDDEEEIIHLIGKDVIMSSQLGCLLALRIGVNNDEFFLILLSPRK